MLSILLFNFVLVAFTTADNLGKLLNFHFHRSNCSISVTKALTISIDRSMMDGWYSNKTSAILYNYKSV